MPIPVNCPHCEKEYRLTDRSAGLWIRCTACKQAFRVPAAGPVSGDAQPEFAAATRRDENSSAAARGRARDADAGDEEDEGGAAPDDNRRPRATIPNWAYGALTAGTVFLVGGIALAVVLLVRGVPSAPALPAGPPPAPPAAVKPAVAAADDSPKAEPTPDPAVAQTNRLARRRPSRPAEADPAVKEARPAQTSAPRPAPSGPYPILPADDGEQVTLWGPADDVTSGGGGRYLFARISGQQKLAVFDAQTGKLAKQLPLLEEGAHVAAGATELIVVYPEAKLLHAYDLTSFQRTRSAPLPAALTKDGIHQITMGSASNGPLFVYLAHEKRTLAVSLPELTVNEVKWNHWSPNNAYGPLNMRPSPDGRVLVGWGGGWAGLDVATFSNGQQTGASDKYNFSGGPYALPSADGLIIYTPRAIVHSTFGPETVQELKDAYVVPAVDPGYFLALRDAGTLTVYTDDRHRLFTLTDLAEIKGTVDMNPYGRRQRPGNRPEIPLEKRVYYYPRAGLLVTLGKDYDRFIVRHIDLPAVLERSGADYLVVASRVPVARAGSAYTYRLDVRSRRGGVKVKLEQGPPGLAVTPDGEVTWAVPAESEKSAADALVTVSDASGQEVAYGFKINISPK